MNESTPPDTPFPRHPYYYIALKFVVLAIAMGVAVYLFGRFW
jgi:hypothetical protein